MFKELKPMLAKRSLVLTLSSIGDDHLRVTITPRPTGKDEAKELAQPFAVEGTAEELDSDLPAAIISYTAEHMTMERSLAQVKANMEVALKEAKDEAAKKVAEAKKNGKTISTAKPEITKPEAKRLAPPSLFDTPEEPPAATSAGKRQSTENSNEDDSDEGESDDAKEPAAESPEQTAAPIAAQPAASVAATKQPSMFNTQSEEDEILQEAFYGTNDNVIAA